MQRYFSQLRTILVQLKLFAPRLAEHRIVVRARFLANEKRRFFLFLRLGHFSCKRLAREQNSVSKSQSIGILHPKVAV